MTISDNTFKILVMGENRDDKTAFIKRYCYNIFKPSERLTIGVDFHVKTIEINNSKIKLNIWSVGGAERFQFLLPTYCKGADGAFYLYDITSRLSLEHLPECVQIVRKNAGDIPVMLVGSKIELSKSSRQVPRDYGIQIAKKNNMASFVEISAKENINVDDAFKVMIEMLVERHSQDIIENPNPPELLKFIRRKDFEFKVNEYLILRLENAKTNIYVEGKLFKQCKYLLFNVPIDKKQEYDEIESIDEAAGKLNSSMEKSYNKITPETEFWGHCSNMQAWYENSYDTRMVHRSLAFPLLKALMIAGDLVAKRVFKEEIGRRLESGYPSTVWYLIYEGYLMYLNREELDSILEKPKFIKNLPKWYIENCIPKRFIKRIKAKLKDRECQNCGSKISNVLINSILNGKSMKCEFCDTDVL